MNQQLPKLPPNPYDISRLTYSQSSYDGVLANHKIYQEYQQKNNSVIMKPESLHPSVIVSRPVDSNSTYTNRLQKNCRDQSYAKTPAILNHNNNNYPNPVSANMGCMEIKQSPYEDNYGPKYPKQDLYFNSRQPQYIYPSTIYSPNVISPTDSNVSDTSSTKQNILEECSYASRCSTSSSVGSIFIHDNDFKNPAKYPGKKTASEIARKENYSSDVENFINTSIVKRTSDNDNNKLDLRKFLSTWDETDDEIVNQDSEKNVENVSSNEQLYVLEYTNISTEDLDKYKHITQITELPENIRGFTSVTNNQNPSTLNDVKVIPDMKESSIIQYNDTSSKNVDKNVAVISSKINDVNLQCSKPIIRCQETNLQLNIAKHDLSAPPSPVDIETILSQSVISKEAISCSFDIKPCDAVQKQFSVHISHTDIQPNNVDSKSTTDIGVQTLLEQNVDKLHSKHGYWSFDTAPKSNLPNVDYYQQNGKSVLNYQSIDNDSNAFTSNYTNERILSNPCRFGNVDQRKPVLTDCMYSNKNISKDFSTIDSSSEKYGRLPQACVYNVINFNKDDCQSQNISKTPVPQNQPFNVNNSNSNEGKECEFNIESNAEVNNLVDTFGVKAGEHDPIEKNIMETTRLNSENKFQILSDVLITDQDKKHLLRNCNYQNAVNNISEPSNFFNSNEHDCNVNNEGNINIKSEEKEVKKITCDVIEPNKIENILHESKIPHQIMKTDITNHQLDSNTFENSNNIETASNIKEHTVGLLVKNVSNKQNNTENVHNEMAVEKYSCKVLNDANIKMIFVKDKSPKHLQHMPGENNHYKKITNMSVPTSEEENNSSENFSAHSITNDSSTVTDIEVESTDMEEILNKTELGTDKVKNREQHESSSGAFNEETEALDYTGTKTSRISSSEIKSYGNIDDKLHSEDKSINFSNKEHIAGNVELNYEKSETSQYDNIQNNDQSLTDEVKPPIENVIIVPDNNQLSEKTLENISSLAQGENAVGTTIEDVSPTEKNLFSIPSVVESKVEGRAHLNNIDKSLKYVDEETVDASECVEEDILSKDVIAQENVNERKLSLDLKIAEKHQVHVNENNISEHERNLSCVMKANNNSDQNTSITVGNENLGNNELQLTIKAKRVQKLIKRFKLKRRQMNQNSPCTGEVLYEDDLTDFSHNASALQDIDYFKKSHDVSTDVHLALNFKSDKSCDERTENHVFPKNEAAEIMTTCTEISSKVDIIVNLDKTKENIQNSTLADINEKEKNEFDEELNCDDLTFFEKSTIGNKSPSSNSSELLISHTNNLNSHMGKNKIFDSNTNKLKETVESNNKSNSDIDSDTEKIDDDNSALGIPSSDVAYEENNQTNTVNDFIKEDSNVLLLGNSHLDTSPIKSDVMEVAVTLSDMTNEKSTDCDNSNKNVLELVYFKNDDYFSAMEEQNKSNDQEKADEGTGKEIFVIG